MANLLDRVIGQFDTLIPFLAISHEDVFELIKREKSIWFPVDEESGLPDSYGVYRNQITHSAFLLGYSYFEAFLADLVREIYLSRPNMLPKEKQLKYADILKTTDYRAILELMVEREIIDLGEAGKGFYPVGSQGGEKDDSGDDDQYDEPKGCPFFGHDEIPCCVHMIPRMVTLRSFGSMMCYARRFNSGLMAKGC